MTTAVPTRRRQRGAIAKPPAARHAAGDASGSGYPGGKGQAGHAAWIVDRLPTHAYYCEPFAGKAAVFRYKPPALRSLLIDRDAAVIAWHRRRAWPATDVRQLDALNWIFAAAERLDDDWLLYVDPPFVLSTRTKQRIYRFELDDAAHERLLLELCDSAARVAVSGYPSPLYNDLLSHWWCDSREVMTRGGLRLECLWTNYNPARVRRDPPPRPGANWRERQRIARKVARQTRLFGALPDYEQDAILAALLEQRRRRSASTRSAGGVR